MLQRSESIRCDVTAKNCPNMQISTDAPYTRTKFQGFMSDAPHSSFKKLVVWTPKLIPNLHMLSLVKAVPDRLKDLKCKLIAFVLSGKRSKDWKTKSGASSVSRSGTLEETLCL